jgi:hypothetical protein
LRQVVYHSPSESGHSRWIDAARIVRALPGERFEIRSLSRDESHASRLDKAWVLVDSDDPACRTECPGWRERGAEVAVVVVDPMRLRRFPGGESCRFFVESAWSAEFLRRGHGIEAQILDPRPLRTPSSRNATSERYAVFIDPIPGRGVDLFARLADELGQIRPDIRFLVVEGNGTEADLVERGIDLRRHGNVHLMAAPADLRQVWNVARFLIAPHAEPWNAGYLCDAALAGIPAIVADHPFFREVAGSPCRFAPLPGWMTAASRRLPDATEIEPWVDAVIRMWDQADPTSQEAMETRHEGFGSFRIRREAVDLMERAFRVPIEPPFSAGLSRADWAVLVPFLNAIEPECEAALHALERVGVTVIRCRGCSAIDQARNLLASQALQRTSTSMIFIDSDIAFDPFDVLRLFARPEPVVAGIYAKKNAPALACHFPPGVRSVVFGDEAPGLYPLHYAAGGFLRIHASVLKQMIERLALPLCDRQPDEGVWPFFLPLVIAMDDGSHRYLAEDWSFSHRLHQIGVTPLADTTIRLVHIGTYGFTWEDTSGGKARHDTFTVNFSNVP